ncbi:MAG TPA: hypothetical protein VMV69_18655 [Pirellulales bacterium]|nr:hypothetical protein [Pirellulales bacterium]
MALTYVGRMRLFHKLRDYAAFEEILDETLAENPAGRKGPIDGGLRAAPAARRRRHVRRRRQAGRIPA